AISLPSRDRTAATRSAARRVAIGGNHHYMVGRIAAPANDLLEREALAWCASDDFEWQVAGARALAFFRSAESEGALRKLGTDEYARLYDNGMGWELHYLIRQAAHDALAARNA